MAARIHHGEEKVPIPPKDAQTFITVCSYCIVGCGYKVYKWPVGKDGGPAPDENIFGVDLTQQQRELSGKWFSPAMHNVITDKDGVQYNIVIHPDPECVVNKGDHSVRGGTHGDLVYTPNGPAQDRLKYPLIYRGNDWLPTTWDEALELGARVIKAVMEKWDQNQIAMKFFDHGGGGGGFENNWAVGRFFFEGIQTVSCSIHNRPAYNSEHFATGDAGFGALTNAYVDGELADTIVLAGANSYETQSINFIEHMLPNLTGDTLDKKKQEFGDKEPVEPGKMIIVDPRRTTTVAIAQAAAGPENVLHLQINMGTDIALFNAIARVIYENGWHAQDFIDAHCDKASFEAYLKDTLQVGKKSLDEVLSEAEKITGISKADIQKAAEWIAKPKEGGFKRRTLMYYEKGMIWGMKNYENIASYADLALLTHNIGRAGTGCSRLGGHQEGYSRPPYPGKRPGIYIDKHLKENDFKVFWVGGCNPAGATLDAQGLRMTLERRTRPVKDALDRTSGAPMEERVAAVLDALENENGLFVIVQNIYPIETMRYAHLVFPAAQWGEMNLTSMNGERRLRLYEKFMDPPGEAQPDWKIMAMMANTLKKLYEAEGNAEMAKRFSGFDWETDEDVFIDSQRGNGDYKGVTYDMLRKLGTNGVQLPVVKIENGKPIGTVRTNADGKFGTPDGKARFIPAPWPGYPEVVQKLIDDPRYPYWVNNGRYNRVWQTMYDDARKAYGVERLPLPLIEVNPEDAKKEGLQNGDLVELFNPYGVVTGMVQIVDSMKPGHLFMMFEHTKGWLNSITTPYVDPKTNIPWYKGTRAGLRKIGRISDIADNVTFASYLEFG